MLALALPLIVSTMSWTVMNFIDRMFLLWHSRESMAASLPAGMLHFTMICLPLGLASYANTFVAQYHGAGRPDRIGLAVWQGVWIGLVTTPLFLAAIPLAPALFLASGHTGSLLQQEVTYFQVLTFGAGAGVLCGALSSFFTGRGVTWVVMLVDSSGAAMNVLLDYAWIFGHWGLPAMGIEGAAWATVVSQWFRVFLYLVLIHTRSNRQTFRVAAGRRIDWPLLRRLVRFGGPNGLQLLVEVAAFTIFLLLVGRLGEGAMAATTLAFNINSVAFVPMLGLGLAVTTMVGQQLGSGRADLASRATWTSAWIAGVYTGVIGIFYVLTPDLLMIGHAAGTSPEQFIELRDITVVLLRFVAAYCLFDAMTIVFASAIKGAGDTRFILWNTIVVSPGPVLVTWAGVRWFGLGLVWCWIVVTAWICVLGVIYLGRFLQGRWREMRVIEPDFVDGLLREPALPQFAEGLRLDLPARHPIAETPHPSIGASEAGIPAASELIEP
ncbi:MAG: MATE family efflux transporter [Pirellulales bacterium]|nr:MATE family efflux transporter [Pirellulales bacterium]